MRICGWSADVCASDLVGLAVLAEGEHRVVLDHPDLVGRRFVAHVGETLHSAPDRFEGPAAEVADDGGAHAHACLLPLRRKGAAGRGCPRFGLIQKAPLPSPPPPSPGREQGLTASTSIPGSRAGTRSGTSP